MKNHVTDNSYPLIDWRFCDAGAIYYECNPEIGFFRPKSEDCDVVLEGNIFEENFAKNKGGALRYVHKNFTTAYA